MHPLRQRFLLGIGIGVLAVGSTFVVLLYDKQVPKEERQLALVERRTIISSVKATGTVTFSSEQQLKFNQRGTVAAVHVREGGEVRKGDILAELDKTTVLADVRQAQLSLGASMLQLEQLEADRGKSLVDAENAYRDSGRQLAQAQQELRVIEQELPSDEASAERTVLEKRFALAQARSTELQRLASIAESALARSEELLDTLYGVLVNDTGVRRQKDERTIEIHHRLYNDMTLKNAVEFAFYDALHAVQGMREIYGTSLIDLRDPTSIAHVLDAAHTVVAKIYTLADAAYQLMQGATGDPDILTVSGLSALKQTVLSSRTSAAVQMKEVETARGSLAGGNTVTSVTIAQAEHVLKTAEENLHLLETKSPADLERNMSAVTKMQEDVRSKEAALASTVKNLDIQIRLKQNEIAQRSTSLQKVRKTTEDYQIVAPFDGVIRQLDYKVGDNLLADTGEEREIILENRDFLIVTILLDQIDVVRVQRDLIARILLDAVPGREFSGTIDEINATPVEQSGVVSYKVSVKIGVPEDLTILSGMTATVVIEVGRRENVLSVPDLALQHEKEKVIVHGVGGESIPIKIGLSDGRFTEVLSGLMEGDRVLSVYLPPVQGQSGTTPNSAQQFFRFGGGGYSGRR